MLDDLLDLMPPFFSLFRLLQGIVIEHVHQISDCAFYGLGGARFDLVQCGSGQEGGCEG